MKIRLGIILFFVAISISSFGQKITTNKYDKFTKEHIVETSFEKIVKDKSFDSRFVNYMKNVWIGFRKVGDNEYLRVKWCSKEIIPMSKNCQIVFLDNDGNTYTFINTEDTIGGEGKGTVGAWGAGLWGLDIYATGDISQLKGKTITDVRIETTEGNYDFEVDKKATKKIADLVEIFENIEK